MSVLVAASLITTPAFAESLQVNWRYQNAQTGEKISATSTASVPVASALNQNQIVTDHEVVRKTIFLVGMANDVKASLTAYHQTCNDFIPRPRPAKPPSFTPVEPHRDRRIVPPKPWQPKFQPKCLTAKQNVGKALNAKIAEYEATLAETAVLNDAKIIDFIDILGKLHSNMQKPKPVMWRGAPERARSVHRMAPMPKAAARGGFNVTAGGAQDIEQFRKIVQEGLVPAVNAMVVEGFLSEFDLSTKSSCDKLICVKPLVAVDTKRNKLFVQLDMNSKVGPENCARKPLNTSIVIDISGSMSATDGTDKNRLEWTKVAAERAVAKMNANDRISVVVFNSQARVVLPAIAASEKERIKAAIDSLQQGGSTNVAAGLANGYEQVMSNYNEAYENRVILITDAGHNTGSANDNADFLQLMSQYEDEVGLTLLAVGVNFNQKLGAAIRGTKGGNEIFIQSGNKMAKLFNGYAFDLLVTPVAYNFKASLDLQNVQAKLVNTYGAPKGKGPVLSLMNARTLFFASADEGGAMLLEYDLQ